MANFSKPINKIASTLSRNELSNIAKLRQGKRQSELLKVGMKDIFGNKAKLKSESLLAQRQRDYLKSLKG